MSEPISTQLGQFTAPGAGTPRVGQAGDHTFSATVSGPGAVAATVLIEVSNDNAGWTTLLTLSPAGSGSASASSASTSSHAFWRATVLALTGTGVVVSAATEQATDAAQLTSLQKSRLLAVLPQTEALVSEAGIARDEYTDTVTLTATGIVHPMPGRLSTITVVSGSCDLVLADGAGTGTAGIRAIATYAGLAAGDVIPFPGDGLPFVNALLATITGTATLRFEVI